ncbi:Na+ dependent nucleoside transporter N-terminal domain-containing protein, partial [Bizionia paragorgiae]
MKHFFLAITAVFFGLNMLTAQDINKTWEIQSLQNQKGENLISVSETDVLNLNNGEFEWSIAEKNVKASGDYFYQNNLLVFYFNTPTDSIQKYKISELTDSTLVFKQKDITYTLQDQNSFQEEIVTPSETIENEAIISSQGFSFTSLWRGAVGMVSLIFIAFLFSSNRKAIDWKIVGFGLLFQLIIAIGVLKVPFIKNVFEFIGSLFISVLDFTRAGSQFLFDGLVMDMDTFGFIFAFQVLPTIIFFSALTSLLFYLGIIQKVVKAMAWALSKVLKISGAESLSVAGNIFLGQTEAPLLIKAYLEKMNKSEILLVMIGGMATVAGAVLAAYIGFLG